MKKTTSLFGLLVGSLLAITVAFVGLGNNVTHAQNVMCKVSVDNYLDIADKSIELAKKLRVENDRSAAIEHLNAMREVISSSCNVFIEEGVTKRVSFQLNDGENLTPFQERTIALSRDYIDAVTQGNLALASRLALSIENIKAGEKTELIVKTEETRQDRKERIERTIANSREHVQVAFAEDSLCMNRGLFERLDGIIGAIDTTSRALRLANSIEDLLNTENTLTTSLHITLGILNNHIKVLNYIPSESDKPWAIPGKAGMRPGICSAMIPNSLVKIEMNGTEYDTTKDGTLSFTDGIALQDRGAYTLQVSVGRNVVFETPMSITVPKDGNFRIGFDSHNRNVISIEEVQEIVGCMDPEANNFNPDATVDDNRLCEYDPEPVFGCMDEAASNYSRHATEDDGKCEYDPEPKVGCMDEAASNFDPDATEHDSRMCEYKEPEGGGDR